MTRFAYQARDSAGELIRGVLEAASETQAGQMLRAEGKYPIRFTKAAVDESDESDKPSLRACYRRIKRDEVIHLSHQMAVMIETGVTLGEALESIAEQSSNLHFKVVMEDVSNTVQSGVSFSTALARHSAVFPPLMISMLKASEASGTMGSMLERISEYLTKERNTLRAIKGAMMYPMIMFSFAVGVTIFLLAFVLPRFSSIYQNRGAVLPPPTRLLMWLSQMTTTYWYIWLGIAVAVAVGCSLYFRQPSGRHTLDWIKLRTPLTGRLMNQLYVTRAMRTMGTMISAGVPMLDMIAIVREVTNNYFYEKLWTHVDGQLRQGIQLSQALFESDLIPAPVVRMIHSGEKAGRLGTVMDRVAGFTEHDFDESVKRMTQFIEPAMIAFMGGLIGFVAISLLLPIFSVGRVMSS